MKLEAARAALLAEILGGGAALANRGLELPQSQDVASTAEHQVKHETDMTVSVEVKHMSEYDPEEYQDTAITDDVDKAFKPNSSVTRAREDVEPVLGPSFLQAQDLVFTVSVEVKHENELEPELQQPKDIALAPSLEGCESVLGLKGPQTLDTAEGGVPSCANGSDERALQQIVAGCSVQLQRLRLLPCDVCGKTFQKQSLLMNHYFDMHVNEDLEESDVTTGKAEIGNIEKCVAVPELENTANIQRTSRKHLKLHPCNICDEMFAFRADMLIHKLKHSGKEPLSCEICKKLFPSKSDLRIHTNSHIVEKLYACDVCKKRFPTATRLNMHKKIHMNIKPVSCEFCGKKFPSKDPMLRHRRTHTGEKPYVCALCDRQFPYYSGWKYHQITHMSKRARTEKKFQCDYCSQSFDYKVNLTSHIQRHMNFKIYSCDHCGLKFERLDSLKRHGLKHTGDLPFSCRFCNSKFAVKYYLNRHMRSHTKEKPYSCEICDKRFAMKYRVNEHLKVHMRPYQCEMCMKTFQHKIKFERHLKRCEMMLKRKPV